MRKLRTTQPLSRRSQRPISADQSDEKALESTWTRQHNGVIDPFVYLSPNLDLPRTDGELNELGIKINEHLRLTFEAVNHVTDHELQFGDLDAHIFASVQTFGALALLAPCVQRTVHHWQFEHGGPGKLRKLGEELAKATELRRGIGNRGMETKGTVTPQHLVVKQQLVPELKLLQQRMDDQCDSPTDTPQAMRFIRTEIKDGATYPCLRAQFASLMRFLETNPEILVEFRNGRTRRPSRGTKKRVSAVQFFYSWLAYTLNLTPEVARQALTPAKL